MKITSFDKMLCKSKNARDKNMNGIWFERESEILIGDYLVLLSMTE